MAKKEEKKSSGNGHNRIEGFVFGIRLEGTEQVVTEGIKAFTSAMAKGGVILTPGAPSKGVLASSKIVGSTTTVESGVEDSEATEELSDPIEQVEDDAVEESSNGDGPGKKRSYNFRPPKFMNELDLSKAKKPLSDFVDEKGNPTALTDKYLVVAVWLKDYMDIEEFTIHHIFTAFDNLGWKGLIPVDHSEPLRALKTKKHYLTKDQGGKGYKVNWQGSQYIENMGAKK